MYPTLSDLLFDLFGVTIPLPIQSFGFFVAIAFIACYQALSLEMKRKEKEGLMHAITKQIIRGVAATPVDFAISSLIGAAMGYKLLDMVLRYNMLVENPQEFILSTHGNWVGALVGGLLSFYLRYKEDLKERLPEPVTMQVSVAPHQHMGNIIMNAAIGGILGAKIFHNLENLDEFFQDPVGSLLSFSGLTFYGGLIVGAALVLRYTSKNGISVIHMLDAAAPALMLGYGMGRIGCQVSGDGDWGIVNINPKPGWMSFLPDWTWAYNYPHNVVRDGIPIDGCAGKYCYMLPQSVYPTPLYEIVVSLLLFVFLWGIRKKIKIPGMLFSIYLVLNGVERFCIEKIRVNSVYHIFGRNITQAEIISMLLFMIGIAGIIYLGNNKNKTKG
jgi:prolipoprotein diacylglyceryl transferase